MPPPSRRAVPNKSRGAPSEKRERLSAKLLSYAKSLHEMRVSRFNAEWEIRRSETSWEINGESVGELVERYKEAERIRQEMVGVEEKKRSFWERRDKAERRKRAGWSEEELIRLGFILALEAVEKLGNGWIDKLGEEAVGLLKELEQRLANSQYLWVKEELLPVIKNLIEPGAEGLVSTDVTPNPTPEISSDSYWLTKERMGSCLSLLEREYAKKSYGMLWWKRKPGEEITNREGEIYVGKRSLKEARARLKEYDERWRITQWFLGIVDGSYAKERELITYLDTKGLLSDLMRERGKLSKLPQELRERAEENHRQQELLSKGSPLVGVLRAITDILDELPIKEYVFSERVSDASSFGEEEDTESEEEKEEEEISYEAGASAGKSNRQRASSVTDFSTSTAGRQNITGSAKGSKILGQDSPLLAGNHQVGDKLEESIVPFSGKRLVLSSEGAGNEGEERHEPYSELEYTVSFACYEYIRECNILLVKYAEGILRKKPEQLVERVSRMAIEEIVEGNSEELKKWQAEVKEELSEEYQRLKTAYRKLMPHVHPDRGGAKLREKLRGNLNAFINLAYEGLEQFVNRLSSVIELPQDEYMYSAHERGRGEHLMHPLLGCLFYPEQFGYELEIRLKDSVKKIEKTIENTRRLQESEQELKQIRQEKEQYRKEKFEALQRVKEQDKALVKAEQKAIKQALDTPKRWVIYRAKDRNEIELKRIKDKAIVLVEGVNSTEAYFVYRSRFIHHNDTLLKVRVELTAEQDQFLTQQVFNQAISSETKLFKRIVKTVIAQGYEIFSQEHETEESNEEEVNEVKRVSFGLRRS